MGDSRRPRQPEHLSLGALRSRECSPILAVPVLLLSHQLLRRAGGAFTKDDIGQ